jgi:hypothetical protein
VRTWLAVILVVGCGKGDNNTADTKTVDKSATPEPAKPAAGFDKLTVTVNGVATPMQRGFIKRVSLDQWRIQVSDKEGSCDELISGVINSQQGATSFVATLAKQLAPDGTESTVVTDLWAAGRATKAKLGIAKVTGSADRDSKVEIELAKIADTDGAKKLEIAGTLTATGCGDAEPTGAGIPKVEHVSAARVKIAGKQLDLKGAVKHGDELTLSTGAKDCSDVQPWAQAVLLRRGGTWELSGTLFAQTSTSAATDLKATPGATGKSKDGPTVALTLAGAGKVGDYPVALDGTIEAIECPK